MERLLKTQAEFREADMPMKIKDCQGVRVREYHHRGQYLKGDRVWYQHQDFNAWVGPAEVVHYKENKVWLYTNMEICKRLQRAW